MVKNCEFPKDTLIVGITRNDELFIPSGETVLEEDDKVIFMGLAHSLDILAGKFFHEKTVADFFEAIKDKKTPYDPYLLDCDPSRCEACTYRASCSYNACKDMLSTAGKHYAAFVDGQNREIFSVGQ